jgi:Ca2+-binding RTX toxin-like protein
MTATNTTNVYSAYLAAPIGSTGTGLDQLIAWDALDGGLAGANEASALDEGIRAADGLNQLLIQGLQATGNLAKEVLSVADIVAVNAWVRSDATRLARFIELHGDDEGGVATGFHQIQNNGGNRQFDGRALIDTVQDGLYHFAFPLSADGTRFTNEDGDNNALLSDVARWLTALKTDLTSTNTGLDRIVDTIVADPGLAANNTWPQIKGGALAADGLNNLIVSGINALNQAGAADADATRLSEAEVLWINGWIRSDADRYATFVDLHGDDENAVETGYHLVQNDGANTTLFAQNAINTIFDGIYHIGFDITVDGRFANEDGNANARVSDVAEWITYYYGDPSTTGTGFDRLTDWMRLDPGLAKWTSALDINDGLAAADRLLHLYVDAIAATGVNSDGWITKNDLRLINGWIRANRYAEFVEDHGDDEGDGTETGFHKIQNDGGSTQFFGRNLINTVADGMFHVGFEIEGEVFVNEDGDRNQSLSDLSSWVNYFLNTARLTVGTDAGEVLVGNDDRDQLLGNGGEDLLQAGAAADLLDGGWGRDTLQGGAGSDLLEGGFDEDLLDGGEDGDLYLVSGSIPVEYDWRTYSFQGYDTYADSGTTGTDIILVQGTGPVDAGLDSFGPANGIEQIVNASDDGNGGTALVRLLGGWWNNLLDFSAVSLIGGNFIIDAADGNDTVKGSVLADTIRGGRGEDLLDGGQGDDSYWVSGAGPGWVSGVPYTFEGYDTYADSGSSGVDQIVAIGDGSVDIGFADVSAASGIEQIVNATSDGNGGTALVRLLGAWWHNTLDFSGVSLVGGNFLIDGEGGNDTITGTLLDDTIRGGGGEDLLDGGEGDDSYWVSGAGPGWVSGVPYTFEGYDTYADSGSTGLDQIVAIGDGSVDIGFADVSAASGIEQIVNATSDGNGGTALVRLLGAWWHNLLDFSGVSLIGGNFLIDGEGGNDTINGSLLADTIRGGAGEDLLDGGQGGDSYWVSGAGPEWVSGVPYTFEGYDTYGDTGSSGVDRIVAVAADGVSAVDIGLAGFATGNGIELIDATGTTGVVRLLNDWQNGSFDFSATELRGSNIRIELAGGNDSFVGSASNDRVWGGYGNDSLRGAAGNDSLYGDGGDDVLDGGQGSDSYFVTGLVSGGWESFGGYDLYSDSGSSGIDQIVAIGNDDVDIALADGNFLSTNGIERLVNQTSKIVNGVPVAGLVRLLGNWAGNVLDLRNVSTVGGNLRIEAGNGDDTIDGSSSADVIQAGQGNDVVNGRGGSDTYVVSGNQASNFEGFDSYADSGTGLGEIDTILVISATGSDAVDIGLRSFAASSGIERIDASATTGRVRLFGDGAANSLNFSTTTIVGTNVVIDAADGNDSVVGSSGNDRILTGAGNDTFNGAAGSDTYEVSGSQASGFGGFDTYADAGTGSGEVDRIVAAAGTAAVDIGLSGFSSTSRIEVIDATTTTGTVRLLGDGNANNFNFSGVNLQGTNLLIDLGGGNDTVVGSAGNNRILGGTGTDSLNGGGGSDTYEVTGTLANNFGGYDIYADSGNGAGEVDRIVAAAGSDAVDIGLTGFSATAGIEVIDGTATTGTVRLVGNSAANNFNFSGVSLVGTNLSIDLGAGNDTFIGSAGSDRVLAGTGTDSLNGAGGADTYVVSGTLASNFGGYDIYADSGNGAGELDRIVVAAGSDAVDIGLTGFSATTGIEVIDGTATTGTVRLLGNSAANNFNFSTTTINGANVLIDAAEGNDTVTGSNGSDRILGGLGNDSLNGGGGNDTLQSGSGLDTLTGGGGADRFNYTTLSDGLMVVGATSVLQFERISDFVIGQDLIDVATSPPTNGFKTLGVQSSLTSGSLATLLNSSNFVANGAATFGFGSRTFLALNNADAGFSSASDAVLEITGFTYASGFSSLSQISFV